MKGQNLSLLEKQQLVEAYQSEVKKLQFQTALLKEAVSSLKDSIKEDKKAGVSIEKTAASVVASMEPSTAAPTPKKRGRGRPPKKASAKAAGAKKTTRGRGRPPKKASAAAKPASASSTGPKKKRGPGRPPKKASAAAKPATASATKSTTPKKRGRKPNQKVGGYRLSEWDALIVDGIKQAGRALIKPELLSLAEQKNKAEKLGMDDAAINVKISQCLHKLSNRRDDLVKVSYPGRGFAYALGEWKNSKGEVPKKYLP